jgi:hypothetical protein
VSWQTVPTGKHRDNFKLNGTGLWGFRENPCGNFNDLQVFKLKTYGAVDLCVIVMACCTGRRAGRHLRMYLRGQLRCQCGPLFGADVLDVGGTSGGLGHPHSSVCSGAGRMQPSWERWKSNCSMSVPGARGRAGLGRAGGGGGKLRLNR